MFRRLVLMITLLQLPTVVSYAKSQDHKDLDKICEIAKDFSKKKKIADPIQDKIMFNQEVQKSMKTLPAQNIWGVVGTQDKGLWDLFLMGAYEVGYANYVCPELQERLDNESKKNYEASTKENLVADLEMLCSKGKAFGEPLPDIVNEDPQLVAHRLNANIKAGLHTFEMVKFWDEINSVRSAKSWEKLQAKAKELGVKNFQCKELKAYITGEKPKAKKK